MVVAVMSDHQPAVVIVGMHRSGTSLVASMCQAAGLDVGERLLGAFPGNEAGHFEDLDFHHWHERVLKANGLGAEGFVGTGSITVPDGMRAEAEQLVGERRRLGHPWGWKNPRTTLLLDFWRDLLPEAVFVAVVRPPSNVIDSLFRRGDEAFRTNPPLAVDVCRHYYQAILAFSRQSPERLVVCELERLVERPTSLFATLRERHAIPLADPPDRYRPEMLGKVVPAVLVAALRQSAPDVVELYDALRAAAGDTAPAAETDAPTVPVFHATLSLWSRLRSSERDAADATRAAAEAAATNAAMTAQLLEARVALDDAASRAECFRIAHDRHLEEAAERAAATEAEVRRLEEDLAAERTCSRGFETQAAYRDAHIESLTAERAAILERERSLQAEASRLAIVETEVRRTIDDLEAQLASRNARIETLNAERDERLARERALKADVSRLTAAAEAARREAEHLGGEVGNHDRTIAALREEVALLEADRQTLVRDAAAAEATIDVLRDDVARLEAACRDNIRQWRNADLELARIGRSRSWRLTAPLRSLRRWMPTLPSRTADLLSRLGRRSWRRLPLRIATKQRLREWLFTRTAWAFRWTHSHREWRAVREALARAGGGGAPRAEPDAPVVAPRPPSRPPDGLRVIAMHLPQFHRIPENDAWWGEGFTEWTNVRRGRPFYAGHEQPAVPHPDIGSYDLLAPGTLERQAAMAQRYGIHAFCFYYYWFDGRRLLERPLERLLATGRPDFPFCLCWANENWTRAWDGLDREVLVAQRHSPDSDARFIHDLLPYLRDPRYLRVEGRPLLAVYRAGLLPDPMTTTATWRRICREEGVGEIHLAAVRSFDKRDPREAGFDAAIQFPPLMIPATDRASDPAAGADPAFRGSLFEYDEAVRFSLAEQAAGYPLYRGVMPSWDNTPRRLERGTAWLHASPEGYGRWLRETIALTCREQPPERRLVFVNAWNEWAEGAYLEPDVRHGYRRLEETAAALAIDPPSPAGAPAGDDLPVLVISHDAHLAGAQMVTLRTVQQWRRAGVRNVRIVCVEGGVLRSAFEDAYPTTILGDLPDEAARRRALEAAADFGSGPPAVVYSSTVVNGPVLEWIRHLGMPIVTHAHELQKSIERWAPGEIFAATRRATDLFMAAAPAIQDNLIARHGVDPGTVRVVPAHIACDAEPPPADVVAGLRESWHADDAGLVIFGCGTTDWRKGPDLFCEIAARAIAEHPGLRFVWAGGDAEYHRDWLGERGLASRVHFLGTRGDVRQLLHAADVFLLSSREDPMPLVALEAAATGLPVVCFAGAGDIPQFVGADAGVVVPMEDVAAATEAILELARDPARRRSLGQQALARVRATYDSRVVAGETLRLLREVAAGRRRWSAATAPLVSVIVPNYQHAPHLPARLESILAQGIDDVEIILLDDCSSDGSLAILEAFARSEPRARLVASAVNSGSAFRQWRKGLAMARGRYVWIAESDDAARPGLLETLVGSLDRHPAAVLAYCQSEMIDERGASLGLPLDWVADISPERWRSSYVAEGRDELATALIHKNTIPNVSAVLFRNGPHLADVIDAEMRLCGDWLAYVRLCARGEVAYASEPLNLWRQRTSHSRTRPPGELEWMEGARVIREAATILGLDAAAAQAHLDAFRERCDGWLTAAAGSP